MATTPTINFPVEVELKFKFLVSTPEDYDFLTTNVFEQSIASDAATFFEDEMDLNCIEVNGVKTR